VCCGVLRCVAVCCGVLQCVAVCCSVLRHVAVRCSGRGRHRSAITMCASVNIFKKNPYLYDHILIYMYMYIYMDIHIYTYVYAYIWTYTRTCTHAYIHSYKHMHTNTYIYTAWPFLIAIMETYGVATISRLVKIIGLFCKI